MSTRNIPKRRGHEFLVHGLVVIAWPIDGGNGKRRSPWPARKYIITVYQFYFFWL